MFSRWLATVTWPFSLQLLNFLQGGQIRQQDIRRVVEDDGQNTRQTADDSVPCPSSTWIVKKKKKNRTKFALVTPRYHHHNDY